MKRFLVLLVVLAGGVAWAALSIPSNAATVNGTSISQADLNSEVSAIANSAYYQCYLNSEEYLSSQGSMEEPPVLGAGTGQYPGDHPTATTAFVASYLETDIGHELALQLAAERHVSMTQAGLATGRTDLTGQITEVMSEILQTQQGQNVKYSCSLTGQAITGHEVLDSMPASFVDQQVQFVAEITALEEDLAGVGSSPADLQNYFDSHGTKFDTACISAAVYSSESAAQDAAASVAFGTSFSTLVSNTASAGGGAQGCHPLPEWESSLPSDADLGSLRNGVVSSPISVNNMYVLLQITSRTPTTYSDAETDVANVVQQAGATATQKALAADERRSSVTVNPRYGVWVPVNASVLTPFTPDPTDVLNAAANEPPAVPATASGSGSAGSGEGASGAGSSGEGTGTSGAGNTGAGTSGAGNTGAGTSGTGNTAAGNTGAGASSSSPGSASSSSTPTSG
jgi:hypothetical protein